VPAVREGALFEAGLSGEIFTAPIAPEPGGWLRIILKHGAAKRAAQLVLAVTGEHRPGRSHFHKLPLGHWIGQIELQAMLQKYQGILEMMRPETDPDADILDSRK
jgi:hypothetical protein